MAKYRKKPVIVDAIEWKGNLIDLDKLGYSQCAVSQDFLSSSLQIETLEGVMTALMGDYVIKGIAGELYPCKPDIFKATYEEVNTDV